MVEIVGQMERRKNCATRAGE